MKQYHDLLKNILVDGNVQYEPRTQETILGVSGYLSCYDLRQGFPLVTTKKIVPRLVFEELFWKLRGERNIKTLFDKGVHIWDANAFDHYLKRHGLTSRFQKHSQEWEEEFSRYKEKIANDAEFAKKEGDLGPVYGYQWRHWKNKNGEEIDQLLNLLKNIKEKPDSRYHVMSAWNVSELEEMAIGPCPFWHQFTVYGNEIDLHTVQRSCDSYLGVPFNIAQEATLLHMVAKETGLKPRKFFHDTINLHIYLGVSPRADFWKSNWNVKEFKNRVRNIKNPEEYLELKEWYVKTAQGEDKINERKDHMPFVLEQLSKTPKELPQIEVHWNTSLLNVIEHPCEETLTVKNYDPHEWDSKAKMAA